ncbi:putative reverse transcriptase domain-containing protein [Tanacetum coccineum]
MVLRRKVVQLVVAVEAKLSTADYEVTLALSHGDVNDHFLRIVVLRFAWTLAWAFGFLIIENSINLRTHSNQYPISSEIMPPRMTTRSAGRATAALRGGRTGGRTGRGAQVGNQGSNLGNGRNQNGDAINDNIRGDVGNVIKNNNRRGCIYKELLDCNPKEYDGKGDEAVRNGSLKKNPEKRGNSREPTKDRNARDENKKTRTRNAFATTTNLVRREYNGSIPKCVSCNLHHSPKIPCQACFNYGRPGHMAKDCRVAPRMVNPMNARNLIVARRACYECGGTNHFKAACPRLNQAQIPGGGRPNQVVAIDGGQVCRNNGNQAPGRAFMLGAEKARQDPNIMTVEIDKVIRGCKLEIEGHMFDINFIPFGSRSFDVIIGMDWLSNHKAEIICHEKVVRIPLLDEKVLRVIKEIPEEKTRNVMSANAKEQKQEEIVVVRDFPEVFPDDLSGLPPIREIKFRIELVPGAISVTKSPYRLAPSEMEELSSQLKELQDKGFIRPSSLPLEHRYY